MSAAEQKAKDSKMAQMLAKAGYHHGRRFHGPHPNSGPPILTPGTVGSAKYQRMMAKRHGKTPTPKTIRNLGKQNLAG